MTIRSGRPRVRSPTIPISATTEPTVADLLALSLLTRLSAGWETTAQNTPAGRAAGASFPFHQLLGVPRDCTQRFKPQNAAMHLPRMYQSQWRTGDVAGGEADTELLDLRALLLRLRDDVPANRHRAQ